MDELRALLTPGHIELPGPLRDHSMADWFVERIDEQIADFTRDLKPGEQMDVVVVLNDGQRIRPTWFGYHNPNLLIIDGTDQHGRDVCLLVPHTNVQILMTLIEAGDVVQRPTIGFQARTRPASPGAAGGIDGENIHGS